jgi:hypothetical protein
MSDRKLIVTHREDRSIRPGRLIPRVGYVPDPESWLADVRRALTGKGAKDRE